MLLTMEIRYRGLHAWCECTQTHVSRHAHGACRHHHAWCMRTRRLQSVPDILGSGCHGSVRSPASLTPADQTRPWTVLTHRPSKTHKHLRSLTSVRDADILVTLVTLAPGPCDYMLASDEVEKQAKHVTPNSSLKWMTRGCPIDRDRVDGSET